MVVQIIIIIVVVLSLLLIWNMQRKRKKNIVNIQNLTAQKLKQKTIKNKPLTVSPVQPEPEIELPLNPDLEIPANYQNFKLLTLDQTAKDSFADILTSASKPNPLLLALAKKSYPANELYKLIKTDPEMSALILIAVNSPHYRLDKPITSVNHAIVFLGVNKVKDIVIQCSISCAEFVSSEQQLAYEKLWQVSHIASSIAYIIAKQTNHEDPAQLSTSCLLSYLGDQAILSARPKSADIYLNTQLSSFERSLALQTEYSLNSPLVGRALSSQWGLPQALTDQIGKALQLLAAGSSLDESSASDLQQNIICYIAGQLAEALVLNKRDDIAALLPINSYSAIGLAFINIPDALKKCKFQELNKVINSPMFLAQANKLTLHLSHS